MTDTYFVMHFMAGAPEIGPRADKNDLHITFLAMVDAPARYSGDMMLAFYDVADETTAFTLEYGEAAQYGKNGEHNVIKMVDVQSGAQSLHDALMARFRKVRGAEFKSLEYSDDKFSSHTTLNEVNNSVDRNPVLVNHITFVRHTGGFGSGDIEMVANAKLGS